MTLLGVVVTHPRPDELERQLAGFAPVTRVGAPNGQRLPVVLELHHHRDDVATLDALRSMPGVLAVDLAFADFSDEVPT